MGLNKDQEKVVYSNSSKILCLAGAGTGKSFTLLERINRLIDEGTSPDSILALTFTNAAAREMADRFKRKYNKGGLQPKFCTFHAFCYSLIVSDKAIREKIGYSKVPMICIEAVLKRITTEAEQATGITKDDEPKSLADKKQQEILKKYIRKQLIERNMITFDIMCSEVCQLFIDNDDLVKYYHDKYTNIFIDEFQDTDELQWNFAKSFKHSNILIVGDTLQAIYGFRGADDSIIKSLCTDKDWDVFRLPCNYRSDKEIVEYANDFSEYADESYRVTMDYVNDGGVVKDKTYSDYERQNSMILENIQENKDTAILARTNKEVYHIQQLLKSNGIDFRNNHTTPNSIGIDLCKSIDNVEYAVDWLASFLSKDIYNDFLRESLLTPVEDQTKLLSRFMSDNKTLATMYRHYNQLMKYDGDIEKITKYLVYDVHTSSRILGECEDLSDIIEILETNSDDDTPIYVGTIHSVKGLEFDNVIVTGVNTKVFNLDYDDNKNLFYVAVTRAKHDLTVLRRA